MQTAEMMEIGEKAKVGRMYLSGQMQRRLPELGLIEGTNIECVLRSAKGQMLGFCVRGAIIALRKDDLAKIEIVNWQRI